jgi:hypothetical protein
MRSISLFCLFLIQLPENRRIYRDNKAATLAQGQAHAGRETERRSCSLVEGEGSADGLGKAGSPTRKSCSRGD